ncbi:glycosyltransferase family 4 protein [Protofrankia symbiont of Coriaria ruscifolia]|uniref:glycosyltransferase family 4 protein n=1 Tax=Protofrankia symbiont of Coriaria ruscifolia TaxID=1306542 RepID=UPI0010416CBC|nr:glycosyltransferase family 4 protein [Protofrankia symbiont of Coriaria ruscifolia]
MKNSIRHGRHARQTGRTGDVLLLAPSLGLGGGIERYLATLEQALDGSGAQVRRVDLLSPGRRPTLAAKAAFAARALVAARRHSPIRCLLVGHPGLIPVAAAVTAAARPPRSFVAFYGTDIWGTRPLRRTLLTRLSRARPLTISSFSAGAMVSLGIPAVLPPGIDPVWRQALLSTPRPAGADRVPVLLTVCRLPDWRGKGVAELVEATRQVRERIGAVRLVVAGQGPAPSDLVELLAQADAELHVSPSDAQLAQLYCTADLFALCTRTRVRPPSSGEGFGIVLVEAQLAGCPVVAPFSGGSSDAYVAGVTGWSPTDESAPALAELVLQLLSDRSRLAEAGGRAREWARTVTDPDAYAEQTCRILLGRDGPSPAGTGRPSAMAGWVGPTVI